MSYLGNPVALELKIVKLLLMNHYFFFHDEDKELCYEIMEHQGICIKKPDQSALPS